MYTEEKESSPRDEKSEDGTLNLRAEEVAVKFLLLSIFSALVFVAASYLYPRSNLATNSLQSIALCTMISLGSIIAWELIALGVLLQSKIKILYFLLGASFKTAIILLLVHQLETEGQGLLKLQLVSFVGSLFLTIILATIFRRWLFEIKAEERCQDTIL